MPDEIYKDLKLTAVECPKDVTLPSWQFVSNVLGNQLSDIGMSMSQAGLKFKNKFVPRPRNGSDPQYSLDSLMESPGDILGHYSTDVSGKAEITLYVDSCSRASADLSVSLVQLLHLVLIHELAHHATAWAEIRVDQVLRWTDYNLCFSSTWASVHEFFSQALCFTYIVQHREELLNAFRTLSRHQPSVYRTWEVLDAFNQNAVGLPSIRASLQAQFLALLKTRPQHVEIKDMHTVYNYNE